MIGNISIIILIVLFAIFLVSLFYRLNVQFSNEIEKIKTKLENHYSNKIDNYKNIMEIKELLYHIHYYLLMFTDYQEIQNKGQIDSDNFDSATGLLTYVKGYSPIKYKKKISYKDIYENLKEKSVDEIKENPINIKEFIEKEEV